MIDALTMAYPDATFLVPTQRRLQVSITEVGDAAVDMDRLLGMPMSSSRSARSLVVQSARGRVVVKTGALLGVETLAEDRFYRLPTLLRDRCRFWVRGLVLRSQEADELAVWIDLGLLVEAAQAGSAP